MEVFVVCVSIFGLLLLSIGIGLLSVAIFCKITHPIKAGATCTVIGIIIIAILIYLLIAQGQFLLDIFK